MSTATSDTTTGAAAPPGGGSNTLNADNKIETDLKVVEEKMDLCHSMLNPGEGLPRPSIQTDETVRAVIGFLEACAPRLVELISASATDSNLLSETVLVRCFSVQERLTKLLEQVETLAMTETSASTTAAAPAASSLLDMDNTGNASNAAAPPANAKTTGEEEEDPFGNLVSSGGGGGGTAAINTKSSDEFDDFFATRQQNQQSGSS